MEQKLLSISAFKASFHHGPTLSSCNIHSLAVRSTDFLSLCVVPVTTISQFVVVGSINHAVTLARVASKITLEIHSS